MRIRRLLTLPAAALLVGVPAAPIASAQSASGLVVHRQSVLTEVDAIGTVGTSRVFTQVNVPGSGELALPGQSTSGLRRLSGADLGVKGGVVTFGAGMTRTVANNTADLPVSVEMRYAVDGRSTTPNAVVGHDGDVAVTYVVRNLTAAPTDLTLVDGDGKKVTRTVDVAVPMVGSLSLTLPAGFRDVVAPGAVVVGDGRGGTVVSWSLLLFSPLGSETQEVTWTARTNDAMVPAASLQVVPVTPDSFGSLRNTEAAYSGAVDATTELTGGAREIDANLRRLAAGAAQLLDGLTQLRDGSQELAAGLTTAATGANDLSAGLSRARGGSEELDRGLGELSTGARTIAEALAAADAGGRDLSTGLGRLSGGSTKLAAGLDELADGATQVDENASLLVAGADELSAGAVQLLAGIELLSDGLLGAEGFPSAIAGIEQLGAGIGAVGTPDTLLDGLALVDGGLTQLGAGIGSPAAAGTLRNGLARVGGGLSNPLCNLADPANAANPCGVTQFNGAITGLSTQALADLQGVIAALATIDTSLLSVVDQGVVADAITTLTAAATRVGTIQGFSGGITTVVGQLQLGLGLVDDGLVTMSEAIGNPETADTLRNGIFRITAGVSNPACDPLAPTDPANPCGLLEGLSILQLGLSSAQAEVAEGLGGTDADGTLLWGAGQLSGGTQALATGASRLQAEGTAALAEGAERARAGAGALADGAGTAAAGAGELSAGLGQIADGGDALSDGATRAAMGSSTLADGLAQLDDGGKRLATGLGGAVDGAKRLADGQAQAVDGGDQIADGSQRLIVEGTDVLAGSVSEATISSSLQLEQVRAASARGIAGEGLPYPTAEGADASAVFQFDLAGVGSTGGSGLGGQLGIGLAALLAAIVIGAIGRPRRREAVALEESTSEPILV